MTTTNQTTKQRVGQAAEQQALAFLQGHGMKLVQRNFLCKMGEIDLIMRNGNTLIFVEVRYRSHTDYGGGLESITPHKQKRIIRTAQYFLLQNPEWRHAPCRIDVIALSRKGENPIQWIPNAIQA